MIIYNKHNYKAQHNVSSLATSTTLLKVGRMGLCITVILFTSLVISTALASEQKAGGFNSDPLPLIDNSLSLADNSKSNCYPWMYQRNSTGTCECSKIPYRAVLCDLTSYSEDINT